MSHIERTIRSWRAPFEVRPWYSRQDVAELETHLRDILDEETDAGVPEEEALWLALSRVGDEATLRPQYRMTWRQKSPVHRYWSKLSAEAARLTRSARFVYASLRAVSMAIGVVAILYLAGFAVAFSNGVALWRWDRPPVEWGLFFTLMVGLQSLFNLVPFGRWENSVGNWLRLLYSGAAAMAAGTYVLYWLGRSPVLDLLAVVCTLGLGPALWISQFRRRRDRTNEVEVLRPA